ncbi:GNAT family N-acetyltransferase [Oricola cellulosilytica]|uniref:N-acetyltransferase family protein n=1 Tax=Oricola cellulosilytica TaxID=1429082 RepID=A0A4R0PCG1_9HYPH|nr:GNAT family N-acetyltransferase [Oricola cellulosilytica]TCD13868.1 N-acetyltransferase family protein [Oricola cellulosilytica]
MTKVMVRDARHTDLPAITAIYRHAVLHGTASFELAPPDQDEMRSRFDAMRTREYPYLVAETEDGAVAGYAYANAYRPRPAYRWAVENSVYIDDRFQGQGVGRVLLEALIARSEALGFRQMIAVIGGSGHKASIRLHESLGFEMVGVLKGSGYKFERWLDSVYMQRPLGEGETTPPDPDAYPGTLYKAAVKAEQS